VFNVVMGVQVSPAVASNTSKASSLTLSM
jgi:hypothetical protein